MLTSTTRRHKAADRRKRKSRRIIMRSCENCKSRGCECVVPTGDPRCTECAKYGRKCDLAPPGKEYERTQDVVEELDEQILAIHSRLARLKKQRKFHLKKLKDMGDREAQNILEIEEDEKRVEDVSTSAFSLEELPDNFDWSLLTSESGRTAAGVSGSPSGAP